MKNRGHWRLGALASAIALLGGMASPGVHALSLGRLSVQSALGESLRAEIDIADLTAQEISSLRVSIAAAESFKAAGLEYTAAAASLDVKLQKRADGRSYLRLSSNRAITEPFVDLILEAKWSSGRVTRDYTMLLDPPNLRASSAAMAPSTAPLLSRAPVPSAGLAPPPVSRPVAVAKTPTVRTTPAERTSDGARQVTVKAGDNASTIASQNKPASVSLDQMLMALLRSNPDAFIGGNINVIKSGAVLDIPDAQAASALSSREATQTVLAQSRDFNTFRRQLAQGVLAAQVDDNAKRQAGGKVQTRVDDRAQTDALPDKLTLSKGSIQDKAATAAGDLAAHDAASRVTELSKNNISDLNKLGAAPATAAAGIAPAPGSATSATSAAAIAAAPALASTSETDPNTDLSASETGEAQAPLAAASAPVPAAVPAAAVVTPPAVMTPTPSKPGLVDQMLDNSLLLLAAGGLLALLAALGFSRYRKSRKTGQVDSSFLDSRLQPDSFFGASGGRRIDTSENNANASSMAYSPNQLDTGGDVDPVAEADVYLAYGRDQQAEEILREALRTHPARLAIHAKLLEIYARRRDLTAFESVALAAFKLSKGQGTEWAYMSGLGRDIDPSNTLYQPGADPLGSQSETHAPAFTPTNAAAALNAPVMASADTQAVDIDLDFSLDEAPVVSLMPAAIAAPAAFISSPVASSSTGIAMPSAILNLADLDLNLDNAPASVSSSGAAPFPETDFLFEEFDFTPEPLSAPKAAIAPEAPVTHSGMLEFDLDPHLLDLGPATQPPPAVAEAEKDPLEIKFLLAEEFRILGDSDGARSLADEVLAKARGPLKAKAQAFLNALA